MPLPPHEQALVAVAADFAARVVAPQAAGWEAGGLPLPRTVTDEYAALGLAALQAPRSHGGHEASYPCKLAVAEAIAAQDFAAAFALNNMQGSVTRIAREGSGDQVARFLPRLVSGALINAPSLSEPGAGSDFAAIATLATPTEGGWRITGEKAWVTNGTLADQLVLYAQTDAANPGPRTIASFLVDLHAPGITRLPPEEVVSGSAIGASTIRLDEVFVPGADLFAPPGTAFKRGLRGITGARIHVAAMLCATVEAALRLATAHAGSRHAFGRTLLSHQGLRWSLAAVATQLEAARGLVDRAAALFGAGTEAQVEAAMAKKFTAEMAGPAVAACMQAMGAAGLRRSHPLGRHLGATRIAAYVDGTTEIMTERIGAALLTRYGSPA